MSTRGLIAIEAADRSCRSIYVHFDMYPSGAGVCLNAHYNTKERIEALGGKVTGSVSKNTDYLINNDNQSNSTKNKKAKELGIPILTEEEFLAMIQEGKR